MIAVWPDCVEAVLLFVRVATQWRTTLSGVVGLDYNAVRAVAEWRGVRINEQLFEDLRVMEQAALEALNERKR